MIRLTLSLLLAAGPAFSGDIVAARLLPAGTAIVAEDLIVDPSDTNGIDALVGLAPRTAIYAGRPVTAALLTTPKLINRNQIVTLTYAMGALEIATEGRALGAGGSGDLIRVMNLSSRATVDARINPDGTATVAQR